jgi:HK97 gp10 family phage protein
MAFKVSTKIDAGEVADLVKTLMELDKKVARKALRKGLQEGAKLVLKDARSFVPTETKSLKKALGTKLKSFKSGAVIVALVGPRKDAKGKPAKYRRRVLVKTKGGGQREMWRNPVKYAHLVEFGTRPHALVKGARLIRKNGKGGTHQRGVLHPGAKPSPFLRPALDKNKSWAKQAIINMLKIALDSVKKKARK